MLSHTLQYIIYQPTSVNTVIVDLVKDSKFKKGACVLYVLLIQAIVSGSLDPTDLLDWFRKPQGDDR